MGCHTTVAAAVVVVVGVVVAAAGVALWHIQTHHRGLLLSFGCSFLLKSVKPQQDSTLPSITAHGHINKSTHICAHVLLTTHREL